MQEHIEKIILEGDDITWKDILVDLVRSEDMDPWDIDLTILTESFIKLIQQMQEADLRISGKMCLAAAILLKLKTNHLVEHDISKLDELLNEPEEDEFYDEDYENNYQKNQRLKDKLPLIPKNPQPRSRKVSINDLVEALQKAMTTRRKKLERDKPEVKSKRIALGDHIDALELVQELYNKITYYSKKKQTEVLSFKELLPPKAKKQDKVYTFIPLLQLENQKKIITEQKKPFDDIKIALRTKKQEKLLYQKIKNIEKQEIKDEEEAKKLRRQRRFKKKQVAES
tara:strand:- start:301 stop:1152 length:852 start_codon:yes stop_codon:yes gene_type:complete